MYTLDHYTGDGATLVKTLLLLKTHSSRHALLKTHSSRHTVVKTHSPRRFWVVCETPRTTLCAGTTSIFMAGDMSL